MVNHTIVEGLLSYTSARDEAKRDVVAIADNEEALAVSRPSGRKGTSPTTSRASRHNSEHLRLIGVDLSSRSRRGSWSESDNLVGLGYVRAHTLWEFRIELGGILCD